MQNEVSFLSALCIAAGVACSTPPAQPAPSSSHSLVVPASWTRVPVPTSRRDGRIGTPHEECAAHAVAAWTVSTQDNRLDAVLERRRREPQRDPLPYDIDFAGALEEQPEWPPPIGSSKRDPNYSSRAWAVMYGRDHARRAVLTADDGWFVAFDGGEYGGSLWWYPRVAGPGRKLWHKNVRWLFRDGADLIAVGGLAHGRSEGVVVRLSKQPGHSWAVVRTHPLLGAPFAVTMDSSRRIVIATTYSVELVESDSAKVLSKIDAYQEPYSIAVARGGAVAIGLPLFVRVLQPDGAGYRDEWYLPPRCQTIEDGDFECVCTGPGGP